MTKIKGPYNFVNCKLCSVYTLTPPTQKNPVYITDHSAIWYVLRDSVITNAMLQLL
jgi:hypothetical protein